jgi:hypothetical protein
VWPSVRMGIPCSRDHRMGHCGYGKSIKSTRFSRTRQNLTIRGINPQPSAPHRGRTAGARAPSSGAHPWSLRGQRDSKTSHHKAIDRINCPCVTFTDAPPTSKAHLHKGLSHKRSFSRAKRQRDIAAFFVLTLFSKLSLVLSFPIPHTLDGF